MSAKSKVNVCHNVCFECFQKHKRYSPICLVLEGQCTCAQMVALPKSCKGPYGEMLLHANEVSDTCVALGDGVPQQLGDVELLGVIQASLETLTCTQCGSQIGYRNVDKESLGRVIINNDTVLEQVARSKRVPPGPVNYLLTVNQGITFVSQKHLLKRN